MDSKTLVTDDIVGTRLRDVDIADATAIRSVEVSKRLSQDSCPAIHDDLDNAIDGAVADEDVLSNLRDLGDID